VFDRGRRGDFGEKSFDVRSVEFLGDRLQGAADRRGAEILLELYSRALGDADRYEIAALLRGAPPPIVLQAPSHGRKTASSTRR